MAEHNCNKEDVIRVILGQLSNGKDDFRELRADVKQILQELAALKEKARGWGAIFGAAAAIIVNVIIALFKG